MKKSIKLLSVMLIAIMIVASLGSVVFAAGEDKKDAQDSVVAGIIKTVTTPQENAQTQKLQNVGGTVVSIIQVVGIIVAILVIMIIGIKYMMGSAEEKAEYKKVMIPYVIGAILIFAASTIVNVVYQISQGLVSAASAE